MLKKRRAGQVAAAFGKAPYTRFRIVVRQFAFGGQVQAEGALVRCGSGCVQFQRAEYRLKKAVAGSVKGFLIYDLRFTIYD